MRPLNLKCESRNKTFCVLTLVILVLVIFVLSANNGFATNENEEASVEKTSSWSYRIAVLNEFIELNSEENSYYIDFEALTSYSKSKADINKSQLVLKTEEGFVPIGFKVVYKENKAYLHGILNNNLKPQLYIVAEPA